MKISTTTLAIAKLLTLFWTINAYKKSYEVRNLSRIRRSPALNSVGALAPDVVICQPSSSNSFSMFISGLSAGGDISRDIDPLTAGMSPDEITNYVSNVGGGLCGYPDALKSLVGLGLNLNLLVFGIFVVSYGILTRNIMDKFFYMYDFK